MATNGTNGVEHTYALTETHKNVCMFWSKILMVTDIYFAQMLERSLVESDPEIAAIMVGNLHHVNRRNFSNCFHVRSLRFNDSASLSFLSPQRMLLLVPSLMPWDRPCQISTLRDIQARGTMVEISISTPLS